MTVAYVELADYLAIATEITGLDIRTVVRVTNLDLADSALHAPQAGFGDRDFYPGFIEQAGERSCDPSPSAELGSYR